MILEIPFFHVVEAVRRRRRAPDVLRVRDFAAVDVASFAAEDLEPADIDLRISSFSSATDVRIRGWRHDGAVHLPVVPEREVRIVAEGSRLRTSFRGSGHSAEVAGSTDLLVHRLFAGVPAHAVGRSVLREEADAMDFVRVLRSDREERLAETSAAADGMILVDGVLHSRFVAPVLSPNWGSFHLADRRLAFSHEPVSDTQIERLLHLGSLGTSSDARIHADRSGFDLSETPYPDLERDLVLLARTLVPNLMRMPACEGPLVGLLDMERRLCAGTADRGDLPEFMDLLASVEPAVRSRMGPIATLGPMFAAHVMLFREAWAGAGQPTLRAG